jgi:hypothetical protein
MKSRTHWTMDTVVSDVMEGSCDMALDPDGQPHIIYQDDNTSAFMYAYENDGIWEHEVIDPFINSPSMQASLDVDTEGTPHVVYCQTWHNKTFRYAIREEGTWNVTVLKGSNEARAPSLAVSSAGHPHICYNNDTGNDTESLEYIQWDGTEWIKEAFTPARHTAIFPDIALDADDTPHIVFSETNDDHNDILPGRRRI